MINKYKKLFANTTIFFISEFASKVLVFLLLPLYTSYLTTVEYGVSDLIFTTVILFIPLFTLSIQQATLRFAMEKKNNPKHVLSFSIKIVLCGFAILVICFPFIVNVINIPSEYVILFYLLYITSAFDGLLSFFVRAIDKTIYVGISGVIKTVITIFANIIMLVILRKSVFGYVMSSIIAYTVSSIFLIISCKLYKYLSIKKPPNQLTKSMIRYSVPLIPNSISWWLSNFASKFIILFYISASAQGVYSVASKIPAVLTTIQSIFIHAWQLSAISEYDQPDRDAFFSSIYRLYDCTMVLSASALIMLTKIMSKILFSNAYYDAWRAVPFLMISVVFGALSGYLGTVFAASKKNVTMFTSTSSGAVFSVLACFILVPRLGIVGAALSTALANILIWFIRLVKSIKHVKICFNLKRATIIYCLLFMQAFSYIYLSSIMGYTISIIVFTILFFMYRSVIRIIKNKAFSLFQRKLKLNCK